MFDHVYDKKKVFVTGHTGFKGSWLCSWLLKLGAEVCGYSFNTPTQPSHFETLGLKNRILHVDGDIRDRDRLLKAMRQFRPEFVFHLAAQPIVRQSYNDPVTTFETNIMGTVNILETIRQCSSVQAGVIITSDKCYRNVEWTWGYRENDVLGGEDPYSASKGCAELVIYSYIHSFFKDSPRVASARAGNVVGGGDWAEDRIVPDAVRSWSRHEPLILRNPHARRPWQHVLEPLSGYLWLGAKLWKKNSQAIGQSFNFGPGNTVNQSVEQLVGQMALHWPDTVWKVDPTNETDQKESTLLKLCCDKALQQLDWRAILSFEETAAMTVRWYQAYYEPTKEPMTDLTDRQINDYTAKAGSEAMPWAMS